MMETKAFDTTNHDHDWEGAARKGVAGPEIEAVHLRARVAELEQICAAQRDELAELRARDFSELTERELRVLDMWPRFEDGVPVMYEDAFRLGGETHTAYGFNFGVGGRVSISAEQGSHVRLPNGERVERPAPEVLDADGVPIRVGDTVWSKDGCEAVVTKVERDRVFTGFEDMFCTPYEPSDLTHREPDSWEKLVEDAAKGMFGYWKCFGTPCEECPSRIDGETPAAYYGITSCLKAKQLDVIRRAKKLAGVAE